MLKLINVSKVFNGEKVVENLSLEIESGEFFSLLGPSGCGKSTLLRMIAGLENLTSGEIWLDGQRIDCLPPQQRPVNMVFQKYALFPHLTVYENIAFGLKLKKMPQAIVSTKVDSLLEMVGLQSFRNRLPETLSGGQAQRVAIARALVNEPKALLLDEPLSALDQKLREHMQVELKDLQTKLGITFIYVTHDQEEALALSDRVAVMNKGKFEQVSHPEDLYDAPKTLFTALFVGSSSSLFCKVLEPSNDLVQVQFQNSVIRSKRAMLTELTVNQQCWLVVRPERIHFDDPQTFPEHFNRIGGKVTSTVFRGTQTEILVEVSPELKVKAISPYKKFSIQIGDQVSLAFDPEDTFLFLDQ